MKARLPYAIGWRRIPTFAPADNEWTVIGGAYRALDRSDRDAIAKIVNTYFRFRPAEDMAVPVDEAVKVAEAVRDAAGKLAKLLKSHPSPSHLAAKRLIREKFAQKLFAANETDLNEFEDELNRLVAVSAQAGLDLRQTEGIGFRRHHEWRQMGAALLLWAHGRDLPVTISKGAAKSRDPKLSPFPAFVRRLQGFFPPEYREFSTDDALSRELADLRRELFSNSGNKKIPARQSE